MDHLEHWSPAQCTSGQGLSSLERIERGDAKEALSSDRVVPVFEPLDEDSDRGGKSQLTERPGSPPTDERALVAGRLLEDVRGFGVPGLSSRGMCEAAARTYASVWTRASDKRWRIDGGGDRGGLDDLEPRLAAGHPDIFVEHQLDPNWRAVFDAVQPQLARLK